MYAALIKKKHLKLKLVNDIFHVKWSADTKTITFFLLTCMSRRVMKPLFSMSHIWKNSRVFSWTVLRPMSWVWQVSEASPFPLLCHEVWPEALLAPLAHETAEAAMASASLSVWDCFPVSFMWAVYRWDAELRDPGEFQAAPHQSLCHRLPSLSNHLCNKSIKQEEGQQKRVF